MKRALWASWFLFGLYGVGTAAADFVFRDGYGVIRTWRSTETTDAAGVRQGAVKVYAHLDDEEIAKIREACR